MAKKEKKQPKRPKPRGAKPGPELSDDQLELAAGGRKAGGDPLAVADGTTQIGSATGGAGAGKIKFEIKDFSST